MIEGYNYEGSYQNFLNKLKMNYNVDSWAEGDENVYQFELPGCKKEDISIVIEGRVLHLRAKYKTLDYERSMKFKGYEPVAKYENGLLEVRTKKSLPIKID